MIYLPLLLTRPGQVGADTKTYLYLDPGRLLSRAAHLWDPNIGLGTVTHQNIGYLWPLGPYYWLMETIGFPDWVAQRLWLGSIMFLAGLGVRWMLRELRWDGAGVTVASFAYALSPYVLEYAARISVILLPFAGLPWLVGLAARALRRRDWSTPAVFALVTLTVGGVNATSLILVMVGPLLWMAHATFVERSSTLGNTVAVGLRIVVLTAATSSWWLAGLALQGAYGIPILRYTETYQTVAAAALAPEVLRGLGYWLFYGTDGLGPWTRSTVRYLESPVAIAASYLVPLGAFVGGLVSRWRHRIYFAVLVAVGAVLSIGAHPWDDPSPYGAVFRAWTRSDLGLSFRSTPRAAPLVVLGLAVFLGAGVAALSRWRPRLGTPVAAALILLILFNQAPLFVGQMVDRNLVRDEQLPQYWLDAAAALSDGDPSTRVYEVPGIDFASYRWGNTVDPITPGLTDREYVARELIPYGSPPSAALLNAVESPFQSGRPEPDGLASLARLMGVGQIVLRGDTQYERYRTPRPRNTAAQLRDADGLRRSAAFGEPVPNRPDDVLDLDDEVELGTQPFDEDPAPVELYDVEDPRAILRTMSASAPVVVAGDAAGLVAMAGVGSLPADRPLFFSASYAADTDGLAALVDQAGAELVVTDSNRRRATRWSSVRDNDGFTERVGQEPLVEDLTDNRLQVFPDADDDARTVTEAVGGVRLDASAYGNGVSYSPGDRAVFAADGDESTAWTAGAFDDPVDEFLELRVDRPVTADRVTLLQPLGPRNRWITRATLRTDGGARTTVELDERSRTSPGQVVELPGGDWRRLRITIDAVDPADAPRLRSFAGVGFAEVAVEGVEPAVEVIRPPRDLLDGLGARSVDLPLRYVFERRGGSALEPVGSVEEPSLRRVLDAPVARSFTPYGRARLSDSLPDFQIDRLIGVPGAAEGGVDAASSARLPASLHARASSAVDGDPLTAYQSPINGAVGSWLQFNYGRTVSVDDLVMTLRDDSLHSLPSAVTLSVDGAPGRQFRLDTPSPATELDRSATTEVRVPTGSLQGRSFRLTIDEVRPATSTDWFSGDPTTLPVGIAEVGLPVVDRPGADEPFLTDCREDLVFVDGRPVPLRLTGTVDAAVSREGLTLESCGAPVELLEGRSTVESAAGRSTGIDVDLLAFSSAAGGAPGVDTLAEGIDEGPPGPRTVTERPGRNHHRVRVSDARDPYWVVLGQSYSPGFRATLDDGTDLGEPTLINGYANGWLVDPAVHGASVTVDITWPPQRLVWFGLAASALGLLVCLALVVGPLFRRREATTADAEADVTPLVPQFALPWQVDGQVLGWTGAAAATAATGVLATFFGSLELGALTAALTLLALRVRHGAVVVRLVAVAALGAAAGFITLKQARNDFLTDFSWVSRFETTHAWGLLAVFALVVAVVADGLRTRQR